MVIADRALTLEEFLSLPERKPPYEYEDGEVTRKFSPRAKHSVAQNSLIVRLGAAADAAQVFVLPELRVTFGGYSVVPDICIFRRERLPLEADGLPADDVFLAPDLVVEIVSPKQSVNRLVRRCLWYVANGVRIALLVDVYDRSVLLFRPGVQPQALRGAVSIDVDEVVPGFRLTVAELFDSLRLR